MTAMHSIPLYSLFSNPWLMPLFHSSYAICKWDKRSAPASSSRGPHYAGITKEQAHAPLLAHWFDTHALCRRLARRSGAKCAVRMPEQRALCGMHRSLNN